MSCKYKNLVSIEEGQEDVKRSPVCSFLTKHMLQIEPKTILATMQIATCPSNLTALELFYEEALEKKNPDT